MRPYTDHSPVAFGRHAQRIALLSLTCLSLTGCWSVGPDFSSLKSKVLQIVSFTNNGELNNDAEFNNLSLDHAFNNDERGLESWWSDLNDPVFETYFDVLMQQNLDLYRATSRIQQASSELDIAKSSFLPTLGAEADGGRSFAHNSLSNSRAYTNTYNAGLNASWQTDLFGRLRKTQEASEAEFIASIQDREALAHTLVAALFDLRVAVSVTQDRLHLSQQAINNRQNYYDIIKRRYEAGSNGIKATDVYEAKQSLDTAKSDAHDYKIALTENMNAIDILLGRPPGTTPTPQTPLTLDTPARAIPACIPVSLIDRRPDLQAEELRLKATNAQIGIAMADLYPDLTFSGTLGFSSDTADSFLNTSRLAGSILSSITARLYEGGALRSTIDLRKAEADEAAAAYASSILTAVQDVENALKSEDELTQKLTALLSTQRSQDAAHKLTKQRYNKGISPILDVLDAQYDFYQTQLTVLTARQNLWSTRTALYLALGGNWFGQDAPCDSLDNTPDFIPASAKGIKQ